MTLVLSPIEIVKRREAEGRLGLLAKAEGWSRVRLGDHCKIVNGAPFPSRQFNRSGRGLPLIRIRDVGQDSSDTYFEGEYEDVHLVNPGDLLIGMDGDFRLARWAGKTALLNQRVCKIVIDSEILHERFVEFVLPGYLEAIWQETSSVTVKHLSSKSVQEIPVPVPSLEEQDEIVRILEEQFSRLEAAAASIAAVRRKADQFRRSLLHAAFIGGLTEHGARRVNLVEDQTSSIPDSWMMKTIGDVASYVRGVTYDKSLSRTSPEKGYVPLLRATNIDLGALSLEDFVYVPEDIVKTEQLLKIGDLVVAASSGSSSVVGKSAPVVTDFSGTFGAFCAVLRADLTISNRYLGYYIQAPAVRQLWSSLARGTNINNLKRDQVCSTPIAVPSVKEQDEIVRILDEQFSRQIAILAAIDEMEYKLSALRRSLLGAAFSGELTKEWREKNNG